MTVYCVIPVHNRKEFTRNCLLCLRKQKKDNFEIIVVDDLSTDGTSEMLDKEFPEVTHLIGDGNLWWSGAMNMGVHHVLGICKPEDSILALNDDLEVPEDYMEKLSTLRINPPDTLIGSVIVDSKDKTTILHGGTKQNCWHAKREVFNVNEKITSFQEGYSLKVSLLTGRGVLIPVKAFRDLGLYRVEHYKQYGDIEFSKRAERAGYNLIVSYDLIVYSQPLKANNIQPEKTYNFCDLNDYFFNVRSNTNLKFRFWFAYDTSPNFFQGTIFFLFDLVRITVHFFRHIHCLKKDPSIE